MTVEEIKKPLDEAQAKTVKGLRRYFRKQFVKIYGRAWVNASEGSVYIEAWIRGVKK